MGRHARRCCKPRHGRCCCCCCSSVLGAENPAFLTRPPLLLRCPPSCDPSVCLSALITSLPASCLYYVNSEFPPTSTRCSPFPLPWRDPPVARVGQRRILPEPPAHTANVINREPAWDSCPFLCDTHTRVSSSLAPEQQQQQRCASLFRFSTARPHASVILQCSLNYSPQVFGAFCPT